MKKHHVEPYSNRLFKVQQKKRIIDENFTQHISKRV